MSAAVVKCSVFMCYVFINMKYNAWKRRVVEIMREAVLQASFLTHIKRIRVWQERCGMFYPSVHTHTHTNIYQTPPRMSVMKFCKNDGSLVPDS